MLLQANPATTVQEFSFWDIMFHGNLFATIVMAAVLLLGVLALYIFLERWLYISRQLKKTDRQLMDTVHGLLSEGKVRQAAEVCTNDGSPDGRVLEKGVSRVGKPVGDIVLAMENQAQLEVSKMEKNINLLAAIPSLAPMLGLLGTVIGIIMAFFNMANMEGSFSPKTLSQGIYTALGQTAVGLAVAIPANFFYNLLLTKIDKFVMKMQRLSGEFLDVLNRPS